MRPIRHRVAALWIAAWAIASSAWCLTAAPRLGATFDEPTYVAAGLDRWRAGGIGGLMRLGTMPLAVDAVSLPVWIAERLHGERFRIATDLRGHVTEDADIDRVLPIARAATLGFWWLLLGMGWSLGSRLAGPWAGGLAVALLALEPSLIAHASLATTDIAVTACLLAFAASLAKNRPHPVARILVPGIWLGLAVLSKASAIAFAPLIAAAIVRARPTRGDARSWMREGAWIAGVALAVTFIYCGSDWRREESFVAWTRSLPAGPAASVLVGIADHVPIFSNAGEGLVQQVKHDVRGHGAFLLGRVYPRAVWYYFPVVFAIKTSGAVLVALVVAALAVATRRAAANWALVASGLIVAASPLFRVQTGIRMILPLVALAIVGASAALAQMADARQPPIRRSVRVVSVALVVWSMLAVVRAWPDAIRFANEFAGGSNEASRLVSDSNYDWGQGLPELSRRFESRSAPLVWYWGTDPAIHSGPWRSLDIRAVEPASGSVLRRLLDDHDLAIGAMLLNGSVLTADAKVAREDRAAQVAADALRAILRDRPWTSRTSTFFIYERRPSGLAPAAPTPPRR